jgi:hypothetical protein
MAKPSASLVRWQTDRMPSLKEFDVQCATSLALAPPNPRLAEENLRGYVVVLSAHFQGFARDLHSEAAQVIASKVRPSLQALIQTHFSAHRALDHGNPNVENIAKDFDRFGLNLKVELATDPANALRLQHLTAMNKWRNVAAHHSTKLPPGIPLTLASVQTWRVACDELTATLDAILYNKLQRTLRRKPWWATAREDLAMAKLKSTPLLKLGDRVRVLHHPDMRGRIVELRGALGPGGAQIYRVRFPRKPKSMYVELREDQLIPIPDADRTLDGAAESPLTPPG